MYIKKVIYLVKTVNLNRNKYVNIKKSSYRHIQGNKW